MDHNAMSRSLATLAAVIALPLLSDVALAQSPALMRPPQTLRITGYGELYVMADTATIKLAVVTDAKDLRTSAERNATIAQKVIGALKVKLAGKGQVWTEDYQVQPQYQEYPRQYPYPRPETPPIIGYETSNVVSIRTPETNSIGSLIDAGITAGASRVNSLDFALSNDRKARSEAVKAAALDAMAQVQALAALGIKTKRMLDVSVNVPPTTIFTNRRVYYGAGSAGSALPGANYTTPIEPNQADVTATVSITYEID